MVNWFVRIRGWAATFVTAWAALVPAAPLASADTAANCNAVQNRTGFIRYPLGTIGAWSTGAGEAADVLTRVPRIYPCVDSPVPRGPKEDWRAAISGDPSQLQITYRKDQPSGASTAAITVSPHVTLFQVAFPPGAPRKYLVFDFSKANVDAWAALNQWTERKVTRVDDRTLQATIGEPGKPGAYYVVQCSAPCVSSGALASAGITAAGSAPAGGAGQTLWAEFEAGTVTVAVAESFTSHAKAAEFLSAEGADFAATRQKCRAAWNEMLGRVEMDAAPTEQRMAYTALYTIYANLIDGSDGSCYLPYYPRPRSLASSAYWQFIGGFQSCCWDNYRTPYPFLMLSYPEVMTDILGTYLARYQRDRCVDGNICLFTGPAGGHRNIRFSPVLVATAYHSGVPADYTRLYAALKDNFASATLLPPRFAELGYATQPQSGGKACSETLEWATGFHSLAVLAQANGDQDGVRRYAALGHCYANVWDRENQVFRVKNADGTWGIMNNTNWTWNPNPQGLFEGTTKDWMFSVPHDPYGLLGLPGQARVVERVLDYCRHDTWFNDYQYHYPYLLYYAGAPNAAQQLIRQTWVPLFRDAVMYEGVRPQPPHNGWQTHYTGNSGWLLCSMLGLYPVPTPPGQFLIGSPSVTRAVIRQRGKEIVVQTKHNSPSNLYVRAIKLDGAAYPCYMIPAERLAAGATLELEMSDQPGEGLGDLFIGSSDGFVRQAKLVSAAHLRAAVEAGATEATSKIFCRTRPVRVTVNGQDDHGAYDETQHTLTTRTTGTATIEVFLRQPAT